MRENSGKRILEIIVYQSLLIT